MIHTPHRRGGVLLEVMLSIALFVGAGAFALGATRSGLANVDRAHRQQQAVDLARSKMAELQAGLINLADLQAEELRGVGSIEQFNDEPGPQPRWTIDITTRRSEHPQLSLVELTVIEQTDHHDAARFTVRQLVRLREGDVEDYQDDAMLEGL